MLCLCIIPHALKKKKEKTHSLTHTHTTGQQAAAWRNVANTSIQREICETAAQPQTNPLPDLHAV